MTEEVVIVGAGAAGLCAAWAARQNGWEPLIIEKTNRVGGAWASIAPDLRCLSPRFRDKMPDGGTPLGQGVRAMGNEVLASIERYAGSAEFNIGFNTTATALEIQGPDLLLTTNTGPIVTRRLMVATGEYDAPYTPPLTGTFEGPIEHTRHFDRDSVAAGEHVVVVGTRNSAVVAVNDLLARGARVTVSCRTPVSLPNNTPSGNHVLGTLMWWASALPVAWLPKPVACTESTPAYDPDLYEAIQDKRVSTVPQAVRFYDAGIIAEGNQRVECDRVVMATGYRRDTAWLAPTLTLDKNGFPKHDAGISTEVAGVGFIGLPCMRNRRSGFLRGFVGDAAAVLRRLR